MWSQILKKNLKDVTASIIFFFIAFILFAFVLGAIAGILIMIWR